MLLLSVIQYPVIFLLALVHATHNYAENNGFDRIAKAVSAVEDILPFDTWRFFPFTNVGAPALIRYEFLTSVPFDITIVDIYCSGDIFMLFDKGNPAGQTTIPEGLPTCLNTTSDPEIALYNPAYSYGYGVGPSGYYNLTIVPAVSPWTAGLGAIRFRRYLAD